MKTYHSLLRGRHRGGLMSRLPGDAGLTRAMQEDAGLFQAAHRLLMKGAALLGQPHRVLRDNPWEEVLVDLNRSHR